MSVSGVGVSVDIWALRQAMAMSSMQDMSTVQGQIVNQLSSLDPDLGQNLDVSV